MFRSAPQRLGEARQKIALRRLSRRPPEDKMVGPHQHAVYAEISHPACDHRAFLIDRLDARPGIAERGEAYFRSEEHTSELQSLMRISYAVFCLKKKKKQTERTHIKQ